MPFSKVAALLILTGVSLLGTSVGHSAITLMPPNFPDAKWSVMAFQNTGANLQQVPMQGEEWLRFNRTSGTEAEDNSAQVIYNAGFRNEGSGTPVSNPANQLGDLAGSVILGANRWGSKSSLGVTLRAAGASYGNKDAYYLAVTDAGIGLYWGVGADFLDAEAAFQLTLAPLGAGRAWGCSIILTIINTFWSFPLSAIT